MKAQVKRELLAYNRKPALQYGGGVEFERSGRLQDGDIVILEIVQVRIQQTQPRD